MATGDVKSCPFEKIRVYPECFEDCSDTDACPKRTMPVKCWQCGLPEPHTREQCNAVIADGMRDYWKHLGVAD